MTRKRVLMFAYYFPPLGGGGVQRTLKNVKYLPEQGFEPIVVCGGQHGAVLKDPTLTSDVPPETVVLRAAALPFRQAQWKLDGLLRRAGLPTRLLNHLLWPDDLVGWLPGALWQGMRAVRVYRPDVLYSTHTPATAHVAALILHRITGLPWVADFRDAWTLDPFRTRAPAPLARASRALERAVIGRASRVTVVDESVELLDLSAGDRRRVLIRNGVDPDDLAVEAPPEPRPTSEPFRLSYVGSLYGERNAAPVFTALRELIDTAKLDPQRFEFRIVGHANLNGTDLSSLPVSFVDYVDHPRAVAEMGRASALLFYQPPTSQGSSGKIYEYLASGRPVLCVASPTNLAYRLVEELDAGRCADACDPAAVARTLGSMVRDWNHPNGLMVDPRAREEVLRRFSRRKLAGDLALILREAIDEPHPAPSSALVPQS